MFPYRHFWIVALSSTLLACQPRLEEGELSLAEKADDWISQQGTRVLGFNLLDPVIGFDGASLHRGDGTPLPAPTVEDGTLRAGDNDLVNATISAWTVDSSSRQHSVVMRIDAIETLTSPTTGRATTFYTLRRRLGFGSFAYWGDACAPTSSKPAGKGVENVQENDRRAVLVPGGFSPNGFYFAGGGGFSFACVSGVAAKCDLWGFYPARKTTGTNSAGQTVTVNNSDLFGACMRMARADYCGTGISHTREGTQIVLWDDLQQTFDVDPVTGAKGKSTYTPPAPPADGLPGFYFEAAWGPDRNPVEFVDLGGAFCLDKLRFASIPLHDECPSQLRDPVDHHAKVCQNSHGAIAVGDDDRPSAAALTQLESAGALLFNLSRYENVGLATWATGTAFFTSTRLVEESDGSPPTLWPGFTPPAGIVLPPPGATLPNSEGNVFNPQLPPPSGTIPLYSYLSDDGDYRTTTESPTITGPLKSDQPYHRIALEGYIYPATITPTAEMKLLDLWWNGGLHRSMVTTGSPGPEGWGFVRHEGYILR